MRVQNLILAGIMMLAMLGLVSCGAYVYAPLFAYNAAEAAREGNAAAGIAKVNDEMVRNGATITLAKTYQAAYGKSFKEVPPNGDTGQAFDDMQTATRYFRNLLRNEGVPNANNYVLTRLDHPVRNGIELIAVVYRPNEVIEVSDLNRSGGTKVLMPGSNDYYRPYRTDINDRPLDTVVEWAAVSTDCFSRQGEQAIFLTQTANNLMLQKQNGDFWLAARNWEAGDMGSALLAKNYLVCHAFADQG